MLTRRNMLAGAAAAAAPAFALPASAASQAPTHVSTPEEEASFRRYIDGVKAEARTKGISQPVLDRAFAHVTINWRVIELDRNQPEVKFTWEHYRGIMVTEDRIRHGREQYLKHRDLLRRVEARYGVPPGILIGLWGAESDYGRAMGNMNVIESVATLAWEGRRGAFFRSELMDALKILQDGDITPEQMVGSWAGAMGQTQFMPDCYVKYAVDFDGDGKRDLWNSMPDVFASTANNLALEGWKGGLPWGMPVLLPAGFDTAQTGRDKRRSATEWLRAGVRTADGAEPPHAAESTAIVLPAGAAGEAFLVYSANFRALRAYNPSDYYALSIGLIGDRVVA